MNLENISQLIKNPSLLSGSESEELKFLTEKYPYSQIFSILYLKSLSIANSINFDEELELHAYKITDRVKLFEIIEEKEFKTTSNQVSSTEISTENQPKQEESTPIIESNKKEAHHTISTENKTITEGGTVAPETPKDLSLELTSEKETSEIEPVDTSIDSTSTLIEENEDQTEEIDTIDVSDKEDPIATEKIEEKIEENDEPSNFELPNTPISETDLEIEIFNNAIAHNLKVEALGLDKEDKEELNEVEEPTEQATPKLEKRNFSDWLHSNKTESISKETKKGEVSKITQKSKAEQIVDQFIKDKPSLKRPEKETKAQERPKKEFYSPTKNAKKSLDEKALPVSETLAKVFELQGNFPKAIFAYEQLSLINPEKKAFFANRIKELQKKLNK